MFSPSCCCCSTDVHVNFCPAGPVTEANGATEFFPRSHLVYTRQETDLHQTRAADGITPSHPSRLMGQQNRGQVSESVSLLTTLRLAYLLAPEL